MQRTLILVLTPVLLIAGAHSAAARAKDPKLALSRKHFEAAETFYEQGQFKRALVEYKKAHSYKRFAAFIFNIAQCHRQLKNWKQALFNYKLYLSKKPNAPNRAEVRRRIKEMAKQTALAEAAARARGKLTVISRPAGAQVLINRLKGKANGVTPAILRLKSGSHLVAVRLKGYRTAHRQVTVSTGKMTVLEVTLSPLTSPRRVDPRRPGPTRPLVRERPVRRQPPVARPLHRPLPPYRVASPFYKRWWFWTGLVVTALCVTSGTWFGVKALNLSKEWKDDEGLVGEDPDHFLQQGKEARTIADVMLFSGMGIGLATIIAAAVVGMDKQKERATRTRILPSCTGSGCSLTVTGRF